MLTRKQRRALDAENKKWPETLVSVPRESWPATNNPPAEVWRSRSFLVQIYQERGAERLSTCRTHTTGDRWADNITWDELQEIKRQCGRGMKFAVEIFPADNEVVNVANMRHLWILPDAPAFAWRKNVKAA